MYQSYPFLPRIPLNPHDNLTMIISSLQMLKLRHPEVVYPGSCAGTWRGRDLNSESLDLEPGTTLHCCLSLEKHIRKIKYHGPDVASGQVLFPLYRVSKKSGILLEKSGFPASGEKSDVLPPGTEFRVATAGWSWGQLASWMQCVCSCPQEACFTGPAGF